MSLDPTLLREARAASGLTLSELASEAGVHMLTIHRVEHGYRPAEKTLDKINRALKAALVRAESRAAEMRAKLIAA